MRKVISTLIAAILVEIAIFIVVGKVIGVINTLMLIILTSVIGMIVAKKQGVQSARNIQKSVSEGQPPGEAMVDTFLIFAGGILLVTPGFLTDIVGLSLVIPLTRKLYKPAIYYWLRKKLKNGQVFIIHK